MRTPNDVAIGFVYIPPDGSPHIPYDVEPFEMLQNAIMCKSKQHMVFICGDTNTRTGTYDDYICMDKFEDEIAGLTASYDITARKILTPNLIRTEGNYYLYVNRRVYRFKTEGFPNLNILALDQTVPVQSIIY